MCCFLLCFVFVANAVSTDSVALAVECSSNIRIHKPSCLKMTEFSHHPRAAQVRRRIRRFPRLECRMIHTYVQTNKQTHTHIYIYIFKYKYKYASSSRASRGRKFHKKKELYIAKKEYRMCARRPTGAMPKSFFAVNELSAVPWS